MRLACKTRRTGEQKFANRCIAGWVIGNNTYRASRPEGQLSVQLWSLKRGMIYRARSRRTALLPIGQTGCKRTGGCRLPAWPQAGPSQVSVITP
jgi:hypothetical protein